MCDTLSNIIFPNPWILWIHNNFNNSWTLNSYHKIPIKTAEEFWGFMNNFNCINFADNNIIFTTHDENPLWESNINGCVILTAIKIMDCVSKNIEIKQKDDMIYEKILDIWTKLCISIISERYKVYSVYGITFSMKFDMLSIKIMLKQSNRVKDLQEILFKEYKGNFWRVVPNNREKNNKK